ncbi:hypothetical protein [Nocardiopsis sp. CA-288880]|uniref:hypothetical protein n=1 Tax=Nocardiopsis sp. CA-288880 TaxID=3239995 RepID=UPI003D982DED
MRYTYILTMQFAMGGMDHIVAEATGVITLASGSSRYEAFQQLRADMVADARSKGLPFTGQPTTVFFSLEPDAL